MIGGLKRRRRPTDQGAGGAHGGQTIVEFAIVSVAFFTIVFGAIDFGRSIFLYSQLHNAVRDVAREGKVKSANGYGVNASVLASHVRYSWSSETQTTTERPGMTDVTANVSCNGGCTSGNKLTVTATLPFQAFSQGFLGISPINMTSTAAVILE